jgi:hypothetical protein
MGGDSVVTLEPDTEDQLALPTAQIEEAQLEYLHFPWFKEEQNMEYRLYRSRDNPTITLVLVFLYLVFVVLRCNLSGMPTYNVYWGLCFAFSMLAGLVFFIRLGIVFFKEKAPMLYQVCSLLKGLIEATGLNLHDVLLVGGVGGVGFSCLGRVSIGACPPDVNLFTSHCSSSRTRASSAI